MKSIRELMDAVDPEKNRIAGAVRRMAVTLTTKALWQLAGFVIDGVTQVVKVEPFTGIGIAARPPASGKAEAIVIMVHDAKHPVVIAVRDEKTRAAIAGALLADESMLFNTKAFTHVKANGKVKIGTPAGVAQATLKGQTYRAAEDTMLTALGVFATAIGALNPVTSAAAAITLNNAIAAFKAAAATYLTNVLEVE